MQTAEASASQSSSQQIQQTRLAWQARASLSGTSLVIRATVARQQVHPSCEARGRGGTHSSSSTRRRHTPELMTSWILSLVPSDR